MMTLDQVRELHAGDEVIHDNSGVKRKIVVIRKGRHVLLAPPLKGKGKTAHINLPQFARTHSVPEQRGAAFNKDEIKDQVATVHKYELYFVAQMIDSLKKDGSIPKCAPRVEAYFSLLAAQFEQEAK